MGITSLRPFLQSLCCNSPWNYAVFWKLKHQWEMILLLEDGFCDDLKLRNPMEGHIDDFYLENSIEILSSAYKSSVHDGNQSEYPIALAVSEMSNAYHVYGKGVVGEAACTGHPHWIYSDITANDVLQSVSVAEFPDEWLFQFLTGIKTILLLPVIPHGVLQLGSMEMVAEDASIGAYLKAKFEAHKNLEAYVGECPIEQFSLVPTLVENLEEPSATDVNKMNEDQKHIGGASSVDHNLFTANQMMPGWMFPDLCSMSIEGAPYAFEHVIDRKIIRQSSGIIHAAEPQLSHQSLEDDKSDITESTLFKSFCPGETFSVFCYNDDFDTRMYGACANEMVDFYNEQVATLPTFPPTDCDNNIYENGGQILSFPRDCELHKALGPVVPGNSRQYPCELSIAGHDVACNSIHNRDLTSSMEFSRIKSYGFPVKEDDIGHLLENVANACSDSDDNLSHDNSSTKFNCPSSMKKSSEYLAATKRPSQSKRIALEEEDSVPWNFATSLFTSKRRNSAAYLSPSASSIDSTMSVLTYEQQERKGCGSSNRVKGLNLSSTNKRRVRAGDNRRPRPRDRQLIQDRIKELRELVPNGAKCSIDGLLDKTVKHVLFLRSVTDRADKLRQRELKEEIDGNISKEPEVNSGHQNGTSWAVELGSEQQLYPIVVKDLNHAGHMLIEMLCDDHGRFLEIADVIYRLQMTVLKGVMERRSDNTWACFVVETSKNFHRLDIFWPLMQLLQQNQTPISSKI